MASAEPGAVWLRLSDCANFQDWLTDWLLSTDEMAGDGCFLRLHLTTHFPAHPCMYVHCQSMHCIALLSSRFLFLILTQVSLEI